ncbi:cytochrome P450 [Paraconexibacter sp.]|uniref:cytochrome P450 n=1 Tax=Paraconexibacter sp. TaxID=2949640 RepID=UPI0035640AFA
MSLAGPPPPSLLERSPYGRMALDLRVEARSRTAIPFPPGDTRFSVTRTQRFARNPLPILLDAYDRHGPVFTLRILHGLVVFVLGPQANHHLLVSNAKNFSWRQGHFSDLLPLLGDGLLTIDGDFHRRSRKIMLPAFHTQRIRESYATIEAETERALPLVRVGETLDLYHWTRELALRIAMRALFGLDPDRSARDVDAAEEFEQALGFYARDYTLQILRGPFTPWARMHRARQRLDALILSEITRRRRTGERGEDILSLLLDAQDEDGSRLSDQHVRDEVMTLLFAGHDTTTSTISFMFYELSRNPDARDRLRDRLAAGDDGGELRRVMDETLRLYPPAWVGPRRSIEAFELCGVRVPGGVPVNYSSWASHRLPDVWEQPDAFRPERFAEGGEVSKLPKGAYVPFGGGSRTCIGMRFGQAEIAVIARALMERFDLDLLPGYHLRTRQMPTIGPVGGLPMRVRAAA